MFHLASSRVRVYRHSIRHHIYKLTLGFYNFFSLTKFYVSIFSLTKFYVSNDSIGDVPPRSLLSTTARRPKTFDKQMENLGNQKDAKKEDVAKQKGVYKEAKNYYRHHRNNDKAKK